MANSKDNISKYATSFIGFDEISGNVYDSIGGYVGTLYNAPTRVAGWNGQGSAMSFNGANQYVQFNKKILEIEGNAFTIRFKIKSTYVNNNYPVIFDNRGEIAPLNGNVVMLRDGKIFIQPCADNIILGELYSNFIADGLWHDVLISFEIGLYKIIVDNINEFVLNINKEQLPSTYNFTIGKISSSTMGYFFNGQLDQLEIYDRVISPIPDKYLVFHNNQYKYHNGTSWLTTTNTEANFIQYGMSNLDHITEAQWLELAGAKSLVMWSDFEDKQYAHAVLHTEPFQAKDLLGDNAEVVYYTERNVEQIFIETDVDPYSVYDYISETPTVVAYTESTDDIIVTTTTNPFTLYDEFGDEVEVLYYTDDETVTEANLEITANWSPLDELEGDFEIVTWTDESADTAKREVVIEGLHAPEFVPMQNWIDVANLVGISVAGVTDTFAPFVIQKKNDEALYSYYQGYFFPVTIDAMNLHNYGATPDMINAITRTEWVDFLDGETELRFHFYFSNRSIGTRSKSATLDVVHQIGKIQVLREITQSTPNIEKIQLEASVYSMEGRLEEIERINLNNLLELELRTAILLKMTMIQSNQLIIETFDDNEYEMYQLIDQLVEIPSTEVDEDGNPLPSTWETIQVQKPSDYNPATRAYENEFIVTFPVELPDEAAQVIFQIAGADVELKLTDGTTSILVNDFYSNQVDVSAYNKETLVMQARGVVGSSFKGIAYTWA